MTLNEHDELPESLQDLVNTAAKDVAETAVEIGLMGELQTAVSHAARRHPTITAYELALLKAAEELAIKKKALEAAGFSREEAMQILIAEVSASNGTSP